MGGDIWRSGHSQCDTGSLVASLTYREHSRTFLQNERCPGFSGRIDMIKIGNF